MIAQPIPNFVGQYVTFQDTLPVDDPTETLAITRPDGTVTTIPHASLTRSANLDGTFTYQWQQVLDMAGRWVGQFSSSGADANTTPPLQVYAV